MKLPPDLKVALVHDWLTGMRGGEKCLEAIVRLFPRADLFTLIHLPGKVSPVIEALPIRTSFIQRLPFAAGSYRSYLPFFPRAVESFDLTGYDLVISTSHCVAKGAVSGPATLHLCYCFTPMRYAWDQYYAYFGHLRGLRSALVGRFISHLRLWDAASALRPDRFLTISRFVARRIRKYYRREAEVVYPPVDIDFFTPGTPGGDYYLVVSALAPYKRLDLVVRAAPHLPRPVKIVGTGPEAARLRKLAGPGVEFLGWLSASELREAYRGCRALLFPGEEDFGLTPLEAMACGKPVIGFARGGLTESVIPLDGEEAPATGVFFDRQEPADLARAVLRFEENSRRFDPAAIRERAVQFSPARFNASLTAFIEGAWAQLQAGGPSTAPR